ncbi:MAG: serpin family protein [Bacteroidota bacterium]
MKKERLINIVIISLIVFISLYLISCETSTNNPQDNHVRALSKTEEQIVASSSNFGFNLFKEISNTETDQNIIISPLSISTAFGMALNGAENLTYEQMRDVLGLINMSRDDINSSYKSVNNLLTGIDIKVEFTSANSIWYRTGFQVENSFLNVNRDFFNAEVTEADFDSPATVNLINNWVKEATNEKIDKIIENIDRDLVMYLINAIYFKGTWQYQFDKDLTRDDQFNLISGGTVPIKMMVQKNKFRYYGNSELQAIEMPYGNDAYEMIVVLPNQENNIDDLIQNFDADKFDLMKSNFTEHELTLYFPRFKLEYESKLNDYLIALGMADAFSPTNADFRRITTVEQIYISEVKHKTFIEVNEEGTEAAAVTSIGFSRTSIGDETELRVDRPFLFFIYEKNTNTILFVGKIINPS